MLPFRTILVAADFSHSSRDAFRVACSLAHKDETKLLVLHVLEPRSVADEPVYFGQQSIPFTAVPRSPESHRVLKASLRAIYVPSDPIAAEYLARDGEPAGEILRLAEEARCDLIVMGTHGRAGLDRLLTGSVAEEVIRKAKCPVLTLRSHNHIAKARPDGHGKTLTGDKKTHGNSQGSPSEDQEHSARLPIRCILHPTDFSADSMVALGVARSLARAQGARLVILHVIPLEPVAIDVPPLSVDREPFKVALKTMKLSGAELEHDMKHPVETVLRDGVPVEEVLRMAKEVQSDLIVMGTHGRTGLGRLLMGSIAEQVLRRTACPVLTVRSSQALAGPAPVDGEAKTITH